MKQADKSPLISVIIPVYNSDRTLEECLKSIKEQSYSNIEIIIIIDGATDNSYAIAKKFCDRYDCFSIYCQENSGSGPARNKGLEMAVGEFIMFVDPDDWIEKDHIANLVTKQQEGDYDLVMTNVTSFIYNDKGKLLRSKKLCTAPQVLKTQKECRKNYLNLLNGEVVCSPTCKLYKASIIYRNQVNFPDLRRSQDIVFNYRYFNYVNTLCVSDCGGYNYRIILKKRMARIKPDYVRTILTIYSDIENLHKHWNLKFDAVLCATYLFNLVYSLFEANNISKRHIKYILDNDRIWAIITLAKPSKIHLKLIRKLVLKRHFIIAEWIIKFIICLKTLSIR